MNHMYLSYNQLLTNNFIIDDRFLVNSGLNVIKNLSDGNETRIEQRLLNVLCLLSENSRELVRREAFINRVWNDYGGAEDGLHQAISFLRKALQDHNKVLIETIPRKGYVLNATVKWETAAHTDANNEEVPGANVFVKGVGSEKEDIQPQRRENGNLVVDKLKKPTRKFESVWQGIRWKTLVAFVFILIIGFVVWYMQANNANGPQHARNTLTNQNQSNAAIEVNIAELKMMPEKETYLNTISTTDTNAARYKLVAIRDERPKFYINDQLQNDSGMEIHGEMMQQMLRKLWERQKGYYDSLKRP